MKVHPVLGTNKLPIATRVQILSMLCEGSSMRSISRITGVSINTVTKHLEDAGEACAAFHDEHVRGVKAKRVQVDEIWSFVYAKDKNVKTAKAAPDGAGDAWTWTAIEAETKLIVSFFVASVASKTRALCYPIVTLWRNTIALALILLLIYGSIR